MQNTGEHPAARQPVPETIEFAAIRITGTDRIDFLQGQLTQDLTRLTPEQPLLAGWASPKGRLLCIAWLVDWQDAIWMVVPRELIESLVRRLQMFILRADVQIEISEALVRPVTVKQLAAATSSYKLPDKDILTHCYYNDNFFTILPAGGTGMGLQVQSAVPVDAATPAQLADWQLMNIRAGLPIVRKATQEEFVPQMVNLDLLDAISFTKGCYVGQEIVARTQNLGRIKRRMHGFCTTSTPASGPVTAGAPVYGPDGIAGQVVDAADTADGTELLAVIRLDCLEQALALQADGQHPLVRQSLPYNIP
jgi:folate-binding protein YgfZ